MESETGFGVTGSADGRYDSDSLAHKVQAQGAGLEAWRPGSHETVSVGKFNTEVAKLDTIIYKRCARQHNI